MKRRDLITVLGSAAALLPLAGRAQQKAMPVIGLLANGSRDSLAGFISAFHQALRETGYVEGQNVTIEYRLIEGRYDQLSALIADLVDRIGAGEGDGYHQEGEDEDDGKGGGDGAVTANYDKQAAVERPAGESDDERRQHRKQEAMKKIDAGGDDQHQQPARGRQWRNDRRS